MNYNDFPILSNDEYKFINDRFFENKTFDRSTLIYKICSLMFDCKNVCFNLADQHNATIRKSLELSTNILGRIYNNLSSTFNYTHSKPTEIKSMSLFGFVNKLVKLISQISSWNDFEQKEFYKSILQKTNLELLSVVENIIRALDSSNIYFFKHM